MPQTGCQPRAFRVDPTLDPTRKGELEYKGWEPNGKEDPVCEGEIRTWRVNREGCTAWRGHGQPPPGSVAIPTDQASSFQPTPPEGPRP